MYIICRNDEEYGYWSEQQLVTRIKYGYLQDLLKYLEKDVETYLAQEKHHTFSGLTRQDITAQVGQPQSWGLFVESLCYLLYPENSCQRLVVALQDYYRNRSETLAILKEFEENYTPSQAIHWYTRDTVLFRLLNQALRQQNSELLLLFAFYLRDLFVQLTEEYEKFKARSTDKPVIYAYRGQLISLNEIQNLKETSEIHWLRVIGANSFFSTSLDRQSALIFLNQAARRDDDLQSVLFEIEIDFGKSFALIKHVIPFP
ncbi:unnamed protein product [Adineta ricciae]|uniref:Uncharacterized protein n=1 Tax=Adineta ricciae TaxID=249248 RepID=A0A814B0Z1_ADIRI|nr:unnamed protein product [Adineta ricciae]